MPIKGDLYRARNGNWYAIFLVTPEGIILGDPLNNAFAEWLKGELDSRFRMPVRYVVYSHSHFDHAEGGRVFADTATFEKPHGFAAGIPWVFVNGVAVVKNGEHTGARPGVVLTPERTAPR